jgi:predicted nuclease of restriction endonuclease-like (RecB) superfamily
VGKRRKSDGYAEALEQIAALIAEGRLRTARAVNAVMTATYWTIGRTIVEEEQRGAQRAAYGEELIERLAEDLTGRFGRGFGRSNLAQMRSFDLAYPQILQTVSGKSAGRAASHRSPNLQTLSGKSPQQLQEVAARLPLPWSHYTHLLTVKNESARSFYEAEAVRGGWTVRQLKRQIDSQFYERTLMSRNKEAMLRKGQIAGPDDAVSPEEQIKDPFVLEFLGLKDEYSETEVEEALVRDLETFLIELGGDFAFVGRQRRLRIGNHWFRLDLLFFHRRLRSLVIIDLKLGEFTHADAGQMHLYLNFAREHWTLPGENPPIGVILCAAKNEAVVKYALENLGNKVLAAEYRTTLPAEQLLAQRVDQVRRRLSRRESLAGAKPGRRSARAPETR